MYVTLKKALEECPVLVLDLPVYLLDTLNFPNDLPSCM